jgi:hypothetical protein
LHKLNQILSTIYGVEVDAATRVDGLAAVARALERGDVAHAQLVALFLRMPEPPRLSKASRRPSEEVLLDLVTSLLAAGLLKLDWDPAKHPRWPAGTDGGVGGEFSPVGDGGSPSDRSGPHFDQGIAIPFPGEIPEVTPRPLPFPSEIVVPPLTAPGAMPRNPYPDRADCVKEWADAQEYRGDLAKRGLLGKGDYRRHGKTFAECVMGQVSERCGGYRVQA